MPLFLVICHDKPGHLQTRLDTRDAHLAYVRKSEGIVQAGPFLENGEMCGSMLIIEAPDLATVKTWTAGDPYLAAGLFESVQVNEWKKVIG